jgi:hypothetical protein
MQCHQGQLHELHRAAATAAEQKEAPNSAAADGLDVTAAPVVFSPLLSLPVVLLRHVCLYLPLVCVVRRLGLLSRSVRTQLRGMQSLRWSWRTWPTLPALIHSPWAAHLATLELDCGRNWKPWLSMAPVLSALPQLRQLKVHMQLDREASFRQWVWPRGLRVLELRVPDRRPADGELLLESLSPDRLPALEELTLDCWPDVCALAPLRGHASLRRFTCIHDWQDQLTPEQVGVIRSWPALQYLSLHSGQMTANTLQLLTDPEASEPLLSQLQEVDLTSHSGSDLSELLAFLPRLPSITRLELKQWHAVHLPLLQSLPRLECAHADAVAGLSLSVLSARHVR